MAVADRAGPPVAVHVARASPPEVTRVEAPLSACVVAAQPAPLSGENAADRDPRDARVAAHGLERIAPQRAHRTQPTTQDGRPWRRDKRRWQVERRFAWLQTVRRILVRHDYHAANDLGCVPVGGMVMRLRWYL